MGAVRRGRTGRLVAIGVLAGTAFVVSAPSAGAHEGIEHFCGVFGTYDDDGPITGVLHHVLEDRLRPSGWSHFWHNRLCQVTNLEHQVFGLLGLPA